MKQRTNFKKTTNFNRVYGDVVVDSIKIPQNPKKYCILIIFAVNPYWFFRFTRVIWDRRVRTTYTLEAQFLLQYLGSIRNSATCLYNPLTPDKSRVYVCTAYELNTNLSVTAFNEIELNRSNPNFKGLL
jgi:hypothetical protein